MKLEKYSLGVGDRFGCQGIAQLNAIKKAKNKGCHISPVWNKSHREHTIVDTTPQDVRAEADDAVAACRWELPYYVDADHICRDNVDSFVAASNFFTLDVADYIGEPADQVDIDDFVNHSRDLAGKVELPGMERNIELTEARIRDAATKYLGAASHAAELYKYIAGQKGAGQFITEVSMDETDEPQTPDELLLILKMLADLGVPAQTIAPKFSGSFFKGVDYIGDIDEFRKEFQSDIGVIKVAVNEFGLPENLKLSIHSGSDKFSLYPIMKEAMERFDVGVHLKTAGTTWLEELIGLALSGGSGLEIAKEIYSQALSRMGELCEPYATVVDIDPDNLPSSEQVNTWDGEIYANALRHDQTCDSYNPDLRQLLHVAYKVAAEIGGRYLDTLSGNELVVGENVTINLYERHIARLFPKIV